MPNGNLNWFIRVHVNCTIVEYLKINFMHIGIFCYSVQYQSRIELSSDAKSVLLNEHGKLTNNFSELDNIINNKNK